jgi:hypothetical protein
MKRKNGMSIVPSIVWFNSCRKDIIRPFRLYQDPLEVAPITLEWDPSIFTALHEQVSVFR